MKKMSRLAGFLLMWVSLHLLPGVAGDLAGPVYPPPGGVGFSNVGDSGGSGRINGTTWRYTNAVFSATAPLYWGVTNGGVGFSFTNSSFAPGEILKLDSTLSDLSVGRLVWTGISGLPEDARTVYTRCTLTINATGGDALPLQAAGALSLPDNVGGVLAVGSPTLSWDAHFRFEASFNINTDFMPALDFFETNKIVGGTAFSSFAAGFYYQVGPPRIAAIANRTTQLDTPIVVPFTVDGIVTPLAASAFTARASVPGLVPPSNFSFSGDGSHWSLTVGPAPSQVGVTTITIGVSDGTSTNETSFQLLVNSPPKLRANNGLVVSQGASSVISSAMLRAEDLESGASQLVFKLFRPGSDSTPHNGILKLDGVPLVDGTTFTGQDVENGRLSYQNNGNCETSDDFGFNITDSDGGIVPLGEHLSFNFRIQILPKDNPPTAMNGAGSVPLGGAYQSSFSATNPDCTSQSLTFRIIANGSKGTLVLTNQSTGGFVYTAHAGQTGVDTVVFQVSDGVQDAGIPGAFVFTIENQAPMVLSTVFNLQQDTPFSGFLSARDLDLPPQSLVFGIVSNAAKGSVVLIDPATGAFRYTPSPGRFGEDTFAFKVNDGLIDSSLGMISLRIRHPLTPGDLVVNDSGRVMVDIVDSGTGDVLPFGFQGNLTEHMFGLAVDPNGTVVVVDGGGGLVRIDPADNSQTVLVPATAFGFPVGTAIEAGGNILVSDARNGVRRFGRDGMLLTNFPASALSAPGGIVVAANNDIYVTDLTAFGGHPEDSKLVKFDPVTLAVTTISSGGLLTVPIAMAFEPDGKIVVADAGSYAGGVDRVIRINPVDGSQSVLTSTNLLSRPTGIGVNQAGLIFTGNSDVGRIVSVDPLNGQQSEISLPGAFQHVMGLAVAPPGLPGPTLRVPSITPDGVVIEIKGIAGRTYQLQRSLSLSPADWISLGNLSAPLGGLIQYVDTNSPAATAFYRAVIN